MVHSIDIAAVADQLQRIRDRARQLESVYAKELAAVCPEYVQSALNLVHYMALREEDIRELQESLAALGLSSLGRAERNVMASLKAVQFALHAISPGTVDSTQPDPDALRFRSAVIDANKRAILGPTPDNRDVSIMVTLPSEAGEEPPLVADMLAAGMNIARINCARDDENTWSAMIRNVRAASRDASTECRILMDLPGPKIRTGDLQPGPRVLRLQPRRDALGQVVAPRRVRLVPDDTPWHGTKSAVVPVPRDCLERGHPGDRVRFRDTRGRKRSLDIIQKDEKGLIAECFKGAYIATGAKIRLVRAGTGKSRTYRVGQLPEIEQAIRLRPDDVLILHRDPIPGAPAVEGADGIVVSPAHIACRQPEVFDFLAPGDRVSFDDGRISGVIDETYADRIEITIKKAKPTGSRLRGNRGINFPDSDIQLPGLTSVDRAILDFITEKADAIGLSFVREPSDVIALQEALGESRLGLILKIETRRAFSNLPRLLLTAMRRYPVACMIARGDLAVEAGWARLAELQEEILWLCEAAQVPVIWATQVLERTVKRGQPSRAEISDAAMSQRADCVMLNKGTHIIAAIQMLDNILRRMQGHQYKKTPRLRRLSYSASREAGMTV